METKRKNNYYTQTQTESSLYNYINIILRKRGMHMQIQQTNYLSRAPYFMIILPNGTQTNIYILKSIIL